MRVTVRITVNVKASYISVDENVSWYQGEHWGPIRVRISIRDMVIGRVSGFWVKLVSELSEGKCQVKVRFMMRVRMVSG